MQANVSFSDPHITFDVSLCSHLFLVASPVKEAAKLLNHVLAAPFNLILQLTRGRQTSFIKIVMKKKEYWKEFLKEYFWVHQSTFGLLLHDAN